MSTRKTIRIGVVGPRDFDNVDYFNRKMDAHLDKLGDDVIVVLVSGGAPGVDAMVEDYVEHYTNRVNVALKVIEANWDEHGNAAGFIRNQEIVDDVHRVIAFWDRQTTGTKDTVNKTIKAGKHVKIIQIETTGKRYYSQRQKAEFEKRKQQKG